MKIPILLAFLQVVASTAWANRSDSGISGPSYATILRQMEKLRDTYPELVQVKDYGRSVEGRTLRMLIVGKPSLAKKRPALLMTGSTHGNEYLNIEDRLPQEILKNAKSNGPISRYLNKGGVYLFVPILNPDGYSKGSRLNANKVDLNRDWDVDPAGHKGFKEVETKVLATTLQKLKDEKGISPHITVDYHCCIGALLHPWSYTTGELPKKDLVRHRMVGRSAGEQLNIEVGTTPEILGYAPLGTTKDYYYVKYGALAFTYEGRYGKENQFLGSHVNWWKDMSEMVQKEIRRPFFGVKMPSTQPFPSIAE